MDLVLLLTLLIWGVRSTWVCLHRKSAREASSSLVKLFFNLPHHIWVPWYWWNRSSAYIWDTLHYNMIIDIFRKRETLEHQMDIFFKHTRKILRPGLGPQCSVNAQTNRSWFLVTSATYSSVFPVHLFDFKKLSEKERRKPKRMNERNRRTENWFILTLPIRGFQQNSHLWVNRDRISNEKKRDMK